MQGHSRIGLVKWLSSRAHEAFSVAVILVHLFDESMEGPERSRVRRVVAFNLVAPFRTLDLGE